MKKNNVITEIRTQYIGFKDHLDIYYAMEAPYGTCESATQRTVQLCFPQQLILIATISPVIIISPVITPSSRNIRRQEEAKSLFSPTIVADN